MIRFFTSIVILFLLLICKTLLAEAPPITAISFAPQGKSVVIGSQAGLAVHSWPKLDLLSRLESRLDHIHDLEFSPDGKMLAASGGAPAEAGQVEIYSWPKPAPISLQTEHDDLVYAIAWRDNSRQIATAGADRVVLLSSPKGTIEKRLLGHSRAVLAAAFLSKGEYLATAGIDQGIRIWNIETGKLRRTLDNHTAAVRDLALRPAEEGTLPMIASAGADRTVRLWQPTIGRLVRFAQLPSEPLAIAWAKDGSQLYTSCADGHLRVIDPDTIEVTHDLPATKGWAYSVAAGQKKNECIIGGEFGEIQRIVID